MKKMILFLAMVLGLLMVGTARADGAWVLWQQCLTFDNKEYWYIEEAFPSYESCKAVLDSKLKLGQRNNPPVRYIPLDGYILKDKNGNLNYYYLKCFPESIDPMKAGGIKSVDPRK